MKAVKSKMLMTVISLVMCAQVGLMYASTLIN